MLTAEEPPADVKGFVLAKAKAPQKLGITNYPGWSAYWLEGVTFVKFAAVIPGATYSDLGCAFETFTSARHWRNHSK